MTGTPSSLELIPVLRPRLADARRILPYLERIDATRTYANWGPLCMQLAARLSAHVGLPEEGVVCASSGTSALVAAILGTAGRAREKRPLALLPALTFVATATAVELCGFVPYLCDVDPDTWQLDPHALLEHEKLSRVGLVVPVAPYGRPVPLEGWTAFQSATGIPVVVDGAASFEGVRAAPRTLLGDIPVVLSFHATKSYSTGEGGCILTRSAQASERIARAANFGFGGSREAIGPHTNAKMSEYHAAVGLAELDEWPQKREAFSNVVERYRHAMEARGVCAGLATAPDIASCYVLYGFPDEAARMRCEVELRASAIDFRAWYGRGVQGHPHFAPLDRDRLPVTENHGQRTIGLPMAPDLGDQDIERIASALKRAVDDTATGR